MSERTDQRIDAAIGVVIRVDGKSEPCLTQTVSVHGLAIATSKAWAVGAIVDVDLVHQGAKVSAAARVVSRHHGGIGLEFVDATPELLNAMTALLAKLVGGNPTRAEPPEQMREVTWTVPDAGGGLGGLIRGRQHKARLIDLSLDGAAIAGKNPPEVGAEIIVTMPNYVGGPDDEERVRCTARVVRHTERGFAVQFISPNSLFRRAISAVRKGARR